MLTFYVLLVYDYDRDRATILPMEKQGQEHVRHFFDINGIVYTEFILAGQAVNSAYYCDFYGDSVKMWEDCPELSLFCQDKALSG
jgi:hypothetical protein